MLAERVKTWTDEWKQQGIQQGIEQGMQQGMRQGEAKVLRLLLVHRYGPLPSWVDQRLEQASEDDLEVWAERVLECEALEDVFDIMS